MPVEVQKSLALSMFTSNHCL